MATGVLPKKRLTRKGASGLPKRIVKLPAVKSVSVADVIAAGGPTKYALTKGVDPKKAKISGVIRLSRRETDRWQEELRKQG